MGHIYFSRLTNIQNLSINRLKQSKIQTSDEIRISTKTLAYIHKTHGFKICQATTLLLF